MKLYVAGNPNDSDGIGAMRITHTMRQLRNAGHEITHDWTREVLNPRPSRRSIAEADVRGVEAADALVLVDADRGWGMYVEFGIAVARRIPIIVIEPRYHQVFYSLPQVRLVMDVDGAIEALR